MHDFCINVIPGSNHIDMITKKGSKRLHVLQVLLCSLIPANGFLKVYLSLICPVLEYCSKFFFQNLFQIK